MGERSTSSVSVTGIGFTGLLTIALIVLKLTGYIDWPWLWVWSPLLLGFLCFVGILALFLFMAVLAVLVEASKKK